MIASNHDAGTVTLHCWLLNITNPSFHVAVVIITTARAGLSIPEALGKLSIGGPLPI